MKATIACPTCGAAVAAPPVDNPAFPFCQQRCKLIDLGRWVEGAYVLDPESGRIEIIDPELAEEVELPPDAELH
ncbi:MAG: DNA gyrase inhibitor YacG [Myxococcales bacterium]|nr:DNA gyrase inhibitor YacG [Myxococcales bacterium]